MSTNLRLSDFFTSLYFCSVSLFCFKIKDTCARDLSLVSCCGELLYQVVAVLVVSSDVVVLYAQRPDHVAHHAHHCRQVENNHLDDHVIRFRKSDKKVVMPEMLVGLGRYHSYTHPTHPTRRECLDA